MKIYTGNKDISELVESLSWSGDTKEVARKITFSIAKNSKDKHLPSVTINQGAEVIVQSDAGKNIFGGIIFDIDKNASSYMITYLAYDLMHYINNSDINRVFDTTPESITKQICNEFDIAYGSVAATGINVYAPCLGTTGYEAIMMAYTYASRKNGKKYMPLMKDINKVNVIEKGTQSGVLLDGDYNLLDADYSVTLQNMVNKVLITDKSGNLVKTVQNSSAQSKYGTIQKVLVQEDGEDATTDANNMLMTTEESASVRALSDVRAISGYSIIVREPDTGLIGKFYIESDTHTFTNGKAEMDLTLAFENLMDEKEIEISEK